MPSMQTSTTLIGLVLAVLILYLVRRDHLYLMHGVWWSAVAAVAALLGIWPGLINTLAVKLGFAYPPALLLLLACIVLLIKALHADMLSTRLERDMRSLNQRLAMLELALKESQQDHGKNSL